MGAQREDPSTSGHHGRPPRACILIVDDDPSLVEALRAGLEPAYDVLAAHTGSAALALLARHSVDLVLLDYFLPDALGLAILRHIKEKCPAVFVILMTAFGSEDVSVQFFRGGGRDYLKKPFTLRDLATRIETLLASRQRDGAPRTPVFLPASASADPDRRERAAVVRRAMAFVEAHVGSPLSLDRVAREAGMSRFRFSRAFKEESGLTFRDFLTRLRIARAAELLRDPTRSVSEVYTAVGFQDRTHFARAFRKLTGGLPSQFRRKRAQHAGMELPPEFPRFRPDA